MAIVTINDENLTNIATAIREKNGTEDTYKPSEMADAISAIEVGSGGTGASEYWLSYSSSYQYASDSEYIYFPCEGVNTITFKYDLSFYNYSFPISITAYKGYNPTGLSGGSISWKSESGYKTETILSKTQTEVTGVEVTIDVSGYTGTRLLVSFNQGSSTYTKQSAIHIYDITFN